MTHSIPANSVTEDTETQVTSGFLIGQDNVSDVIRVLIMETSGQ